MSIKDDKSKAALDLLRAIQTLNNDKGIPAETAFTAIERAVRLAIGKHYGDDDDVSITIDRQRGTIHAQKGDKVIDPHSGTLGRIAAQAAKQQMIQLFREEESHTLLSDLTKMKDQLIIGMGTIQRMEGGAAIVSIGKFEAILPRGEMIPGETHHIGEKIRAVVTEVKKAGSRVKVILSRTSPLFVQRLFEEGIREIEDRTIKIERVAREAGYRTKVAVSSIDSRVDCVGACVGVRGARIKKIVEELGGVERIDIVRWNDALQVLIQNSLQPATIEEVFLYDKLERAIVLVQEDQLSLAIGRRGQNVRLASKLVEWDIEIMTHEELNKAIDKAEEQFRQLPGMTDDLINTLIEEGFLSCEDVAVLTPAELFEMGGLDEDTSLELIAIADEIGQATSKEPKPPKPAPKPQKPREPRSSPMRMEPLQRDPLSREGGPRDSMPDTPRPADNMPGVSAGAKSAFAALFRDEPVEVPPTEAPPADVSGDEMEAEDDLGTMESENLPESFEEVEVEVPNQQADELPVDEMGQSLSETLSDIVSEPVAVEPVAAEPTGEATEQAASEEQESAIQ
jgi:N utilization substance protein A